jgi:hypothetical protein
VTRSPLHLLALTTVLVALASALTLYTRLREAQLSSQRPVEAASRWTADRPIPRPLPPRRRPVQVDPGYLVVQVKSGATVDLRSKPFGPVLRRLGSQTEFGSPRRLSVVRTVNGRWLGVNSPELGNGRLGWIDARGGAMRYSRTSIALEVDLSRRQLAVREDGRVTRRIAVGIGRPGSPTPTGRFAITDKLRGADFDPVYGCCILALSGRQPNLPPGWTGGNRLAIHGTSNPGGIGGSVSAGCLHASTGDLSLLMKAAPVGTPVVIHA